MKLKIAAIVTLSLSLPVLTASSSNPLEVILVVNDRDTGVYSLRNPVFQKTTMSSTASLSILSVSIIDLVVIGKNDNENAFRVTNIDDKKIDYSAYISSLLYSHSTYFFDNQTYEQSLRNSFR